MTSNPALMLLWGYLNLCSLGALDIIVFHIWSQPFKYTSFWDFAQLYKTMTLMQQQQQQQQQQQKQQQQQQKLPILP